MRRVAFTVLALVFVVGVVPVAVVQLMGQSRVRGSIDGLDHRAVVIVPGAGLRPDGGPSVYLERRLTVARDLYRAGTVQEILVSGDASTPYHDEPSSMLHWLVGQGVPADAVVRDGGGLDTHDTCVRAHDVYGVDRAVVVTQDYHLRRLLFSCEAAGIDAVGIGVSSTSVTPVQAVVWRLREVPASWKAFLDATVRRPPVITGPFAGRKG
jgi:vancomycin permeability regulator SanA